MTARILVVDDVAANVKLLEARLTAEYYEVVTAFSGREALDICQKAGCDIVLLDAGDVIAADMRIMRSPQARWKVGCGLRSL